jgi:hypothetical protein
MRGSILQLPIRLHAWCLLSAGTTLSSKTAVGAVNREGYLVGQSDAVERKWNDLDASCEAPARDSWLACRTTLSRVRAH